MAQPVDFPGANYTMQAGDDNKPVRVFAKNGPPRPFLIIRWLLSADDRAEIERTGQIWVAVEGPLVSPLLVGSEDAIRDGLAAHELVWPKLNGHDA